MLAAANKRWFLAVPKLPRHRTPGSGCWRSSTTAYRGRQNLQICAADGVAKADVPDDWRRTSPPTVAARGSCHCDRSDAIAPRVWTVRDPFSSPAPPSLPAVLDGENSACACLQARRKRPARGHAAAPPLESRICEPLSRLLLHRLKALRGPRIRHGESIELVAPRADDRPRPQRAT